MLDDIFYESGNKGTYYDSRNTMIRKLNRKNAEAYREAERDEPKDRQDKKACEKR